MTFSNIDTAAEIPANTPTGAPTNTPSGTPAGTQPLGGLRVLDLAWVVAGPLVGRALADFGATVVRVESSLRVETARLMGPFPGGTLNPQQSGLFENCNAGKLGLSLDLSRAEGRAVVRDLVRDWADVVVESFSPGQMADWGLGYADLSPLKPGLLMLSTSLMGQTGPWSSFAGFGNLGAAVAGYQGIVGWPDALPIGPFGPYTDYVAPRFGLVCLLAALDHRRRTGQGGWLDLSQAEAGIQFLAPWIAQCAANGREPAACGNRDAAMAPHGVYACAATPDDADPWVAVAVRSDREWQRLAELVGGAALAHDPRFATLDLRQANEDALEAIVGAWTANRSAAEVEQALLAIGVPVHKAASSADMAADPQLAARGHFVQLPHASMGLCTVENARYLLSGTPAATPRSAPTFGRDNLQVLRDFAGYSDRKITELVDAGVLR